MQFVRAFEALGYRLGNVQQSWSAEKNNGVCISLWRAEMSVKNGKAWMNSREHAGPLELWRHKNGNTWRRAHLARALAEFEGYVDVVIVHGEPGGPYKDADPWDIAGRKGRWRITEFDPETGHFGAEVVAL